VSQPNHSATPRNARLPGFYQLPLAERLERIAAWAGLTAEEANILSGVDGLSAAQADHMVENAIGTYALPLGIATNFLINGQEYLVPMAIEEPSVVAACSFAAKLARAGGGFIASTDEPLMIGQIQVLDIADAHAAAQAILANKEALLALATDPSSSIVKRGGGPRDLEARAFPQTPVGPMVVIHLLYDTRDAMGANAINTACEHLAPHVAAMAKGRVNLRILSNLTDRRKAYARCHIPADQLATKSANGQTVAHAVVEAWAFAHVDPYRAATHNKGIMNGMDAVCMATGNDWRALEAGAHAYAARDGLYRSLTVWALAEDGGLIGSLEVPLAVGTVGGATRVHPTAGIALKILGIQSARTLAEVLAAVGLAQNFAAIRALATDGIQQGHMSLHARQMAVAAGAAEGQIGQVVDHMIAEGNIRLERAKALVLALNENKDKETHQS
jgi:hydroxymethylglutaryl-CoA reductase